MSTARKVTVIAAHAVLTAAGVGLWLNPLSAWFINVRYDMSAYIGINLGLTLLYLISAIALAWGFRRHLPKATTATVIMCRGIQLLAVLCGCAFGFFCSAIYHTLNNTTPLGERPELCAHG